MNRKSKPAIPEPIAELQRQLDQFRSTQPRRTKLPEPLWEAAVELEAVKLGYEPYRWQLLPTSGITEPHAKAIALQLALLARPATNQALAAAAWLCHSRGA